MISLKTAPVSEVTTPIFFGIFGISFFLDKSNNPSSNNFFFSLQVILIILPHLDTRLALLSIDILTGERKL